MRRPHPLPAALGQRFSVATARAHGVNAGRLRRRDLDIPFRGVRALHHPNDAANDDAADRQSSEYRARVLDYAPRLRGQQFISHESAVALLGGPAPTVRLAGEVVDGRNLPVHVSTPGDGPLVRARGARGHRAPAGSVVVRDGGILLAHPATAWSQLGHWPVLDLVALGDFLCRVWRPGPGRPRPGRPPLTTVDELDATAFAVRRRGAARLRMALGLIREDAWSPRESMLRCRLVLAGLPEPALNHDVYDRFGRFLGCVDLAYPALRIAIEYHGRLHYAQYAERRADRRASCSRMVGDRGHQFAVCATG